MDSEVLKSASGLGGILCVESLLEKRSSNGDVKCTHKNVIIPRRELLLYFIAAIINAFMTRCGQFKNW